jgi:SGNH hydrolase-like domain, acetyltransferase AlgX
MAITSIAWRTIRPLLFLVYLVFVTTFALFALFEFFPNLLNSINLQSIRYYAQAAEYSADPTLVFVPRLANRVVHVREFRGGLYSSQFGVEVPPITYHASYTDTGFRTNSSTPPFDVLLIGDSFVEVGESDDSTLSELLKQESGLSTLNLGRGWYGPPQYLEVFKRYGLGTKAHYAILAFFSGNDAEDTRQYMRWQRGGEGGDYYSFVVGRTNFFIRYLHAFRDTFGVIREWGKRYFGGALEPPNLAMGSGAIAEETHPDVGLIQLNGQRVPMYFNYWNPHATSAQLLAREEWKGIRTVIGQFRALALQEMMIPIIVFIPTKAEVYGMRFDQQGGSRILSRIHEQLKFEMNTSDALEAVCQEQKIHLVNLLPFFQALAGEGKVLYHPFDTHWNSAGRRAAAKALAKAIREIPPH